MRTKQEIAKDYLLLLKEEGKITLSKNEIDQYCSNDEYIELVIEQIHNEIGCGPNPLPTSYEKYNGQTISSLRAFEIYCKIIVKEDLSSGKEVWRNFIKMQFELVERHQYTCYQAMRSAGKCLTTNTLIQTSNGLIPIKDVNVGDSVLTLDDQEYQSTIKTISKKIHSGIREVYKITTRSGRTLETTKEHPFFTIAGWKSMNDGLNIGYKIAIPRKTDMFGKNSDLSKARLLGLLVSEAYMKTFVQFSNQDLELHQKVQDCCKYLKLKFGFYKGNKSKSGINWSTRISNDVYNIFPELEGLTSYTQKVPNYIYEGNKEVVIEFLKYLFEGDGGVEKRNSVSYCSMSRDLLQGVQLLLQNLGINSYISKKNVKCNGKNFISFRLFIYGDNVLLFRDIIGFVSKRKNDSLDLACNWLNNRKIKNYNLDVIPSFGYLIKHSIGDQKDLTRNSARKFVEHKRNININRVNKKYRSELKDFIENGELDRLDKLSNSNIYWDEIVNIEYIGELDCYDLQIDDGTNNFVANGIYAHNTFFMTLYMSFKMYLIPYFDILTVFNIPPMIENFFSVFMRVVDNNELLITKKDSNKKALSWGVKKCGYNHGMIKSITLGSTGRSSQVSLVWVDDLLSDSSAGKYPIEYVKKFVLGDLLPAVGQKKGRFVIEGTVHHSSDIYHFLSEDENKNYRPKMLKCTRDTIFTSRHNFACRIFPGILNFDTKEVLVPEAYTYEEILSKKTIMGDFNWWREIQQEVKVDKSALISYYLFTKCLDETLSLQETGHPGKKYVMVVDPSAGEGQFSDYAAITVLEILDGRKIIRYLWHEKFLPIVDPEGGNLDLTHKVLDVYRSFCKPDLWIENNSIGRILIQSLGKYDIEINEHSTDKDKVKIMIDAIGDFKRDNLLIIPNNPECDFTQEWVDILRKEALSYGISQKSTGKLIIGGKGTHDDLVTALLIGLHYSNDDEMNMCMAICID